MNVAKALVCGMKDDRVRSFERAFKSWVGPEIIWFERSRNCLRGTLGGSRT